MKRSKGFCPLPSGDHLDGAVDDRDGGLFVVQWHRYVASPPPTRSTSASRTQGTQRCAPMVGSVDLRVVLRGEPPSHRNTTPTRRQKPMFGPAVLPISGPGKQGCDHRLRFDGGWSVADLPVTDFDDPPRTVGAERQVHGHEWQASAGDQRCQPDQSTPVGGGVPGCPDAAPINGHRRRSTRCAPPRR